MKTLRHCLSKEQSSILLINIIVLAIIFVPWISVILCIYFDIGLPEGKNSDHSCKNPNHLCSICSNENLLKLFLGCYFYGFVNLVVVLSFISAICLVLGLIILYLYWNYDEYQKSRQVLNEKNKEKTN